MSDSAKITRRYFLGSSGVAAVAANGSWILSLLQAACSERRGVARVPGPQPGRFLAAEQLRTVAAFADVLIPDADAAGTRRANTEAFIDAVLAESEAAVREPFVAGLALLDAEAARRSGPSFCRLERAEQEALVGELSRDLEAITVGHSIETDWDAEVVLIPVLGEPLKLSKARRSLVEFFLAAKMLVITEYYTSEVGLRELGLSHSDLFHQDYLGCLHPEHKA
jgi:hypothetical protein